MDSIASALSRVEQLQSRLGVDRRQSGFGQLLDAQLQREPSPSQTVVGGGFTTFGAVFNGGSVIPVATAPPVDGILSAGQLERYLEANRIEVRNGHLTDRDLVAVDGGWHGSARLLPPAAEAWTRMRAAAAAEGVDLFAIDSYRSWESQDRAHREHLAGRKTANVLAPGTSEHGVGLAVDVTNGAIVGPGDREWEWLQDNARRFGWYPISNESWHWEFRGIGA